MGNYSNDGGWDSDWQATEAEKRNNNGRAQELAARLEEMKAAAAAVKKGYEISIHSNVPPDSDFTAGHSWIEIKNKKTGKKTTYGLWTDKLKSGGVKGTPGKGVNVNLEKKNGYKTSHSLSVDISAEQVKSFDDYTKEPDEWSPSHTCADWARDGFNNITGINLDVDDYLGIETPRELSRAIENYIE